MRSPSYPMFDLEEAILKANKLYAEDGKASVPRKVAADHLGYKTLSGPASRCLSGLKQYGLIDAGGGKVQLTKLALNLVIYKETDEIYRKSVWEACLNPGVYRELYEKYNGALPSNEALRAELLNEFDFNPKAVERFISDFRQTIEFASRITGKRKDEGVGFEREDSYLEQEDPIFSKIIEPSKSAERSKQAALEYSYVIPLKSRNKAIINFEKIPIKREDLNRIKDWLDLMADPLTEEGGEGLEEGD